MYKKFYLTLTLVSGLILFVFMLFIAYKEVTPEWKKYQEGYRSLLIKTAKDEASREKAKDLKVDIQQLYLAGLNRVDRCTVCHMGVENPLMAKADLVYKQHSGAYLKDHPADKFGCTVCHNGQGRALTTKEAHGAGRDTHWDYPILPTKYIQSSCAQCHDFEMLRKKGGEIVAEGEKLFREKGCMGCHKLGGVGGILGKALDGIGSRAFAYFPMRHVKGEKTVYAWLKQHFDDPREIVPESEMRVQMNEGESDKLTAYVLSLKAEEIPKQYRRIKQTQRREDMDGMALYKMYCTACHTSGKYSVYDEVFKRTIPAVMNPSFTKAADDKLIEKIIKEGRGETQMTAWKSDAAGLRNDEIHKIIKYITRSRPKEKPEPFRFSSFKGDVKHGEEVYKVRCLLCHGPDGEGGEDILGISLANPIVQKEADPEFLAITVRDGREGTPMVSFGKRGLGLGDQEIADVVTYVRTLSGKK